MQDYVYSIYNDFVINHSVNITILQEEIENSEISTVIHHIDTNIDNDICSIWFNDPLSEIDENLLDDIISFHTGESLGNIVSYDGSGSGDIIFTYGDDSNDYYLKVSHSCYKICSHFIFNGTNFIGNPYGVKIAFKGNGSIRLVDKSNGNVLFEWYDIDGPVDYTLYKQKVSNWPEDETIIELQAKKYNDNLYISCLMISFTDPIETNNLPNFYSSGGYSGDD